MYYSIKNVKVSLMTVLDEYAWLQSNPHVLKDMNLTRKEKEELLQKSVGCHGTVEDPVFFRLVR